MTDTEYRLTHIWAVLGPLSDYVERFATRELAQAAAEIGWCNENDHGEDAPVFEWLEDQPGVYEGYIGGIALEWAVRSERLIWSRPDEDGDYVDH